jgi:nitrate/nitrite transporter NarK
VIIAVFCLGVAASNVWAITQRLAGPQVVGRWVGIQSFVGSLSGVVAPALTGFVLQRTGHFYWAFAIVAAVALVGTASYVFLVGPVEQVTWRKKLRARAVSA